MTLIDLPIAIDTDHVLHIDHYGVSIGAVSVGLPPACTTDDVFHRYLDLLRLVRRDREGAMDAPGSDLRALAAATATEAPYVARRLAALQPA